MAGKKLELGRTGLTVAANAKMLRGRARMNYTEVSQRLAELGRDIPALAVRRIEEGARRIDVDDLMALAVVLGVTPITLLMPNVDAVEKDDLVEMTGWPEKVVAKRLWEWLQARQTLTASYQDLDSFYEFLQAAEPHWIKMRRQQDLWANELRRREDQFYERNRGSADGDN